MTARAERRAGARQPQAARHGGREAAVQMLYQWEVGRVSIAEVMETFWTVRAGADQPAAADDREFAQALVNGVVGSIADIDTMIREAAEHWRIERMNVLDRIVLRLAVYEFLHERETPARVIINEALELARTFSTDDAIRFINGVLDAIRRKLERT